MAKRQPSAFQETLNFKLRGVGKVPEVTLYTTRRCPFCVRAVRLLSEKGVEFNEINIEGRPELRAEMEEKAKQHTVPQIFIGDYHVGGCDDMYALEARGQLDELLGLR